MICHSKCGKKTAPNFLRKDACWHVKEELYQLSAAGEDVVDGVMAVDASLSILQGEEKNLQDNRPCSFNIVLDNVDLKLLASDMTSSNQNKDLHWCNHNAYLDRVNPTHLLDNDPVADLRDVSNSTFLPSLTDQNSLLSDFTVSIGRVLVENLSALEIFKDVVPLHIRHKFSDELQKKTETKFFLKKNRLIIFHVNIYYYHYN